MLSAVAKNVTLTSQGLEFCEFSHNCSKSRSLSVSLSRLSFHLQLWTRILTRLLQGIIKPRKWNYKKQNKAKQQPPDSSVDRILEISWQEESQQLQRRDSTSVGGIDPSCAVVIKEYALRLVEYAEIWNGCRSTANTFWSFHVKNLNLALDSCSCSWVIVWLIDWLLMMGHGLLVCTNTYTTILESSLRAAVIRSSTILKDLRNPSAWEGGREGWFLLEWSSSSFFKFDFHVLAC